jgi:hypothetical protein
MTELSLAASRNFLTPCPSKRGRGGTVSVGIRLYRDRANILLPHAPDHPEIAVTAGVFLQLSAHPKLGQFMP